MSQFDPVAIISDDFEHTPTWLTNTRIGRWLYKHDDMKTHRSRVKVFAKLVAGLAFGTFLIKIGVF